MEAGSTIMTPKQNDEQHHAAPPKKNKAKIITLTC
jgi:hypothetical protein